MLSSYASFHACLLLFLSLSAATSHTSHLVLCLRYPSFFVFMLTPSPSLSSSLLICSLRQFQHSTKKLHLEHLQFIHECNTKWPCFNTTHNTSFKIHCGYCSPGTGSLERSFEIKPLLRFKTGFYRNDWVTIKVIKKPRLSGVTQYYIKIG